MLENITNPTMSWLPWTIFSSFLLIGAVIGFWNGWRTVTYFLGWNIAFLLVGVLLFDAFYKSLVDWAKSFMPEVKSGEQDFGAALEGARDVIKPILGTILMIPVLLLTNFLAFLLYWFFRGNLKRRMKDNKQAQLSNLGVRFVGAGVGVITAFPITVFATTASTLFSPANNFNKITDFMTSGMSFTKFAGTYDAVKSTQDAVAMIDSADALAELGRAFTGDSGLDVQKINDPKARKSIQRILDNDQLMGVLPGLAKAMMGADKTESNDINKQATDLKATLDAAGFKPYTINEKSKQKLINMIKHLIVKKQAAPGGVDEYHSATDLENFVMNSGLFELK